MRRAPILIFALSLVCTIALTLKAAQAQCGPLPYQLTNGQIADATQVMANFNALVNCVNSAVGNGTAGQIGYYATTGSAISGKNLSDVIDAAIGSTRGSILERGASGWALLTPGLAGNVLTSNGTGADPSYTPASSGARALFSGQMSPNIPSKTGTGLSNWLNQGSATESDDANGMHVVIPSNGSTLAARGLYVAAPTPPYTRTILLLHSEVQSGNAYALFGWYDGTAKLQTIGYNNNSQQGWFDWNSVTSIQNDHVFSIPVLEFVWLQLADDGTNYTMSYSYDGVHFYTITSGAKSSGWLGASGYSNIFFGCDCYSTTGHLEILSYQ